MIYRNTLNSKKNKDRLSESLSIRLRSRATIAIQLSALSVAASAVAVSTATNRNVYSAAYLRHSVSQQCRSWDVCLWYHWCSGRWSRSRLVLPTGSTSLRSNSKPTMVVCAIGPSKTRTCTSAQRPLTVRWPATTYRLRQVCVYIIYNTRYLAH